MDILFADDCGAVPPVEFRTIGRDDWVALNVSAATIPIEAMEYRSRCGFEHRSKGPTGVYLEMEWGLDLDWYDSNASWRPYIPLKSEDLGGPAISKSGNDWFSISRCLHLGKGLLQVSSSFLKTHEHPSMKTL